MLHLSFTFDRKITQPLEELGLPTEESSSSQLVSGASSSSSSAVSYSPPDVDCRIYAQYQIGDYVIVSEAINRAAERVFWELASCFGKSGKFQKGWFDLHVSPKNCGATKKAVPTLVGMSAFEQMLALGSWFQHGRHSVSEYKYTFCFSNNMDRLRGKKVPLSIQKGAKSVMQVVLGTGGDYPALKYDGSSNSMAACDPWEEKRTENFIYHLEALEMVRQPRFIGATLIKGNAFESDYIDQRWRYGATGREACVEMPGQKRLSKEKQAIRAQSAAYNLFRLIEVGCGDVDLCDHIGEASLYVSADDVLHSYHTGKEALYCQMFRLMVAKMGPFSALPLKAFVARRLSEIQILVPNFEPYQ